jgi:hypothetical protein
MDAVRSGQLVAASMRDESPKHLRLPPQVFLAYRIPISFSKENAIKTPPIPHKSAIKTPHTLIVIPLAFLLSFGYNNYVMYIT